MKHLLILSSVVFAAVAPLTFAQSRIDLQPDDTIRTVLEKHVGRQPIDLRLRSGEKLIHLSQLSGAKYFDGVIDLNVAAVGSARHP